MSSYAFLAGKWDAVDEELPRPTEFTVIREPARKLRGTWRPKKMRADRHPMYVKPHDERHLWLSPGIRKRRKRRKH